VKSAETGEDVPRIGTVARRDEIMINAFIGIASIRRYKVKPDGSSKGIKRSLLARRLLYSKDHAAYNVHKKKGPN
jgi:hypothetical protein